MLGFLLCIEFRYTFQCDREQDSAAFRRPVRIFCSGFEFPPTKIAPCCSPFSRMDLDLYEKGIILVELTSL